MFEHLIEIILPEIIHLLEIIGVLIVAIGSFRTFGHYITHLLNPNKNFRYQHELGGSLSLGLEFKMGAEILKTVLIRDLSEIWVLAAIIVLRAMLALLLHIELRHADSEEVA
ncbi:MAG: DUF1622 domain-containing protein [Eubacteriaceae bacterium]|nr:DUF1622 domain-containing protein [Eubacteriaceae bacterium]